MRLPRSKERLRREAAAWLARLQSKRDPDAERKFRAWYERSPANAAAFDRVSRSYDAAALLWHSPSSNVPVIQSRPPMGRYAFAVAASLAAVAAAGLFVTKSSTWPFGQSSLLMLTTSVGEIRQVQLSDGSKVTLDTATTIEVALDRSKRRATVKRGRARFEVAAGSRPFDIAAGSITVSTSNSALDVEQSPAGTRVEVIAGRADLKGSAARTLSLNQGEGAIAAATAPFELHAVPNRTDWTRGMLQFDATPLPVAIEQANRYSARQILLGPKLDGLTVTGAFHAGDSAGLAKAVAAALDLKLEPLPNGNVLLSRKNARR